tara:strand:- start:321 stop:599 length:279 start_codon:yes stop_codon:yes gene_type:complete
MGKLTIAEADELLKKGRLTEDTLKEMQKEGLVGRRPRGERRVMKTKNGYVTPQFYFRGKNKDEPYTDKMEKLKNEVQNLINKYTTLETKKDK